MNEDETGEREKGKAQSTARMRSGSRVQRGLWKESVVKQISFRSLSAHQNSMLDKQNGKEKLNGQVEPHQMVERSV